MQRPKQEMRTASVRDLRNHFASVAQWIKDGETVTITSNGAIFATLAPANAGKSGKADWAQRLGRRRPLGRKLSAKQTRSLHEAMRSTL